MVSGRVARLWQQLGGRRVTGRHLPREQVRVRNLAAQQQDERVARAADRRPGRAAVWVAYFAPHCPHTPATPAHWYEDECPAVTAPRQPNWNFSSPAFHALIARQPPFTAADATLIDELARRHARTGWPPRASEPRCRCALGPGKLTLPRRAQPLPVLAERGRRARRHRSDRRGAGRHGQDLLVREQ